LSIANIGKCIIILQKSPSSLNGEKGFYSVHTINYNFHSLFPLLKKPYAMVFIIDTENIFKD